MKQSVKASYLIIFVFLVLLTSCRKEETELIQGPEEQALMANTVVANLMQKTAMNDGSNDNILDKANCFNIQLPIKVKANGAQLDIISDEDLKAVEFILDDDDDDNDTVEILFPVTITLNDFTEVSINSMSELNSFANNCNGENESDDDIECLDFQYPIVAKVFNITNEFIESITFNHDKQLYKFLERIGPNDVVNMAFPIKVGLMDDTEIILNNLSELQSTIEAYRNSCDEDDDYDYNDDDCNTCNIDQIKNILTTCPDWQVDKLERNNYDYDNVYDGYEFRFMENGTISVYWPNYYAYGTWSVNGSGNDMTVVIDIPDLPYCNNNWILHEIQSYSGETRVDFRVEGVDRLRYKNNCN